jgi:predicted permease
MEKAYVQYVSGSMFGVFGLQPAIGRLLTPNDDQTPGAHPYAVLSYDYWNRRFARDSKIVGRTFRLDGGLYQIVGVTSAPFTGTQPGTITDIFIPTMMYPGAVHDDWTWHATFAQLKPGISVEPVRAILDATSHAFEEQRARGFKGMSQETIEKFLAQKVVLLPAAAGASGLQQDYRPALLALAVLVGLVLLIACANVANLFAAQAAARAREIALRVSIGAGRGRLAQLVLVESAMIGFLAAALGALFAGWSAPFVVSRINPPDNPVRLMLAADWRVVGFGLGLTLIVTLLFGLAPALRASSMNPANAIKGGDHPHARRRSMYGLIALQAAFCFVVVFFGGLFAATFDRLSNRPLGFSPARLLNIETEAEHEQPAVFWDQVADQLRTVPGVEKVAIAGWPLLSGQAWNRFISVNDAPPGPVLAYLLSVSPGWLDTMKMPLLEGRDFRPDDTYPGVVMVNETFVKQFLSGLHPLGVTIGGGDSRSYVVVGVVRDAPYREVREATLPVAFVPFHSVDEKGAARSVQFATFIVRTSGANPMALASILRREVPRARPEFRVGNIRTQQEIDDSHTVRERLLAMLALFFAAVALLLAGIGLYGVLDYSVLQRRREIGIRMAIGAQPAGIARLVTAQMLGMVLLGASLGLAAGTALVRYIHTLLYQVKPTEPGILGLPLLTIAMAALLAAVPAVLRAVRVDPAATLRAE